MGSGRMPFPLQGIQGGPGPLGRGSAPRLALSLAVIFFGFPGCAGRGLASTRRGQLHACPPGLGESDGDCLLRRCRAMLAFADVMHLFAHELPGLSAGGLAFTRVLTRTVNGLSFWHKNLLAEEGSTRCGHNCIHDSL